MSLPCAEEATHLLPSNSCAGFELRSLDLIALDLALEPLAEIDPELVRERGGRELIARSLRLGESLRLLRVDPGGVDSTIDSGSDLLKALLRSSPLRVPHEHVTPTTLAFSLTPLRARCEPDSGRDIVRGAVIQAAGNLATYTCDNSDPEHDLSADVGSTRNFQYWFRDPAGGGALFDTSNAISIAILP